MCALFFCAFPSIGKAQAGPEETTRQLHFREPTPSSYTIILPQSIPADQKAASARQPAWIQGRNPSSNLVEFSDRIVLEVAGGDIGPFLAEHNLTLSRVVRPNLYILQAGNSLAALNAAETLSQNPRVLASYPVMRRSYGKRGGYARQPNDPLFTEQWHLENRRSDRQLRGADLNVRAAWPMTRGENVVVAVADDGFQLDHPDLEPRAIGTPHYNFFEEYEDGNPGTDDALHATPVAGLIAAETGNSRGVSGVAPGSTLASWVIFGLSFFGEEAIATDEQLMDMFQYASNRVSVQNHSWGSANIMQMPIDALSETGIENAVKHGRNGKGVIIVRAGGNAREDQHNVNDDGLANDPRVIAVAAVRTDGRVCSYSSPGACILVAAPSGDFADDLPADPNPGGVLTTDLTGNEGYSTDAGGDYTLFDGTSASSPQIAGVAALILSANPDLTYRDVQQVLAQSARHIDLADPGVRTNGAGFLVSHNSGFGVPDAAQAVNLAQSWSNLPAHTTVSVTNTTTTPIPDDSLRLICSGDAIDEALASINCLPSLGVHPDAATPTLPLVDVGQANEDLTVDLTGKGALIERGTTLFWEKIERAAEAGAAFAIIYNNIGTTEIQPMGGTEFVSIPAISIGRDDGEALRSLIASSTVSARIQISPATYNLTVNDTLLCEHVGVRLKTTHGSRSDVRVTLVSPMGTRSVLQKINYDDSPGPVDWTYWTTQHFYETSAGTWRLEVSDELDTVITTPESTHAATGSVTYAEIIIQGVRIADSDRDTLDDNWEREHFGHLDNGPRDDSDADGWINSREQIMRTDASGPGGALHLEIAELSPGHLRLTWPGHANWPYKLKANASVNGPYQEIAEIPGKFPVTEYVVPAGSNPGGFYILESQ